ncbi:MAG: HAMP domain-containing histidine kinase, partial [Bdellovibrionales bacterium]|nr:HAMP domain-containing histidine kinase [Bdellovibrionales bacterium]
MNLKIALIGLSIPILIIAIIKGWGLRTTGLNRKLLRGWTILQGFSLVFLIGFSLTFYLLLAEEQGVFLPGHGIILFAGSIYVLFSTLVTVSLVKLLNKEKTSLDRRVEEQTLELANTLGELEDQHQHLKTTQEHLIESHKMMAIGEVTSGAANEINTPLSTIMLNAETLLRLTEKGGADEKVGRSAKKIKLSAEQIHKIISALLTFSNKDYEGGNEAFSIRELWQSILVLTQDFASQNRVRVEFTLLDATDIHLTAPKTKLLEALNHLVKNAIEAASRFPVRWVRVEVSRDTNWVTIRVSDSGTGIDRNEGDRIFQPFYSTKDAGMG